MPAFIEPLDTYDLFVNTLAGGVEVFSFMALVIISALAARWRMPNLVFGVLMGLFATIMSNYLGGLYLIAVIVTALSVFVVVARVYR